jgi:hypothetical protein
MIREPVFEPASSLESLLRRADALGKGERIPDLDLAMIIEMHSGKALPATITSYLVRLFRREIRGIKGPKLQSDLVKEFRFGPAANLYDHVLPIFEYLARRRKRLTFRRRNVKTGSGYRDDTLTPSERALEYLLEKRPDPDDLGIISTRSLASFCREMRFSAEISGFLTIFPFDFA